MTRTQNEGLCNAPTFTPHRVGVVAADAGVPFTAVVKAHGMVSYGFEEVSAQIRIQNGTPSIDVEVLLWSDLDSKFVQQSPPVAITALVASKVWRFNTGGQRFYLHVSGVFDGGVAVNISCAGMNPVLAEMA